jgi:hypothetical protein
MHIDNILQLATWFSGDAFVRRDALISVSTKLPYWIVVNDDPYATDITVYPLEEGITYFGSEPEQDLTDDAEAPSNEQKFTIETGGLQPKHCAVTHESILDAFELLYVCSIAFQRNEITIIGPNKSKRRSSS